MHQKYPRLIVGVKRLAGRQSFRPPAAMRPRGSMIGPAAKRTVELPLAGRAGRTGAAGRPLCLAAGRAGDRCGQPSAHAEDEARPSGRGGRGRRNRLRCRPAVGRAGRSGLGRYRPDWADVLAQLNVRNVYGLEIALRHYHPRPEAFLQTAVCPSTDPTAGDPAQAVTGSTSDPGGRRRRLLRGQSTFICPPRRGRRKSCNGPLPTCGRPWRVSSRAASRMIDRVPPWEVKSLAKAEAVRVAPYAFPLVHCLIANPPAADGRSSPAGLVVRHQSRGDPGVVGRRARPPEGSAVVSGPLPRSARPTTAWATATTTRSPPGPTTRGWPWCWPRPPTNGWLCRARLPVSRRRPGWCWRPVRPMRRRGWPAEPSAVVD